MIVLKKTIVVLILTTLLLLGVDMMVVAVAAEKGVLSDCQATSYPERPANFGEADVPPLGARVDIRDNGDGTRTISFTGFSEIYKNKIEIYGGKRIYTCPLNNGERRYPAGMWVNTMFKKGVNYTFILVADEYRSARQPWMGNGTCVMPNYGQGSALIYCGDLRGKYR